MDDLDSTSQQDSTTAEWTGAGATAYKARVKEAVQDAETASLAVRKAAKAMFTYADELERLQSERERLVSWRGTLSGARETVRYNAANLDPDQIPLVEGQASDLLAAAHNYAEDCDTLEAAVQANNTTLRTVLGSLSTLQRAKQATAGGDIADALLTRDGAPGTGAGAEAVAVWWNALTEDEQLALIAAHPEVVGAADGVPAHARDQANRILLDNDISALNLAEERGELTADQEAQRDNIRAVEKALDYANDNKADVTTVDPVTGEVIPTYLMLYDPAAHRNEGAISFSVGDPDSADNVAVNVPGVGTNATDALGEAEKARNLYESSRLADPEASTAVVSWIGYNPPEDIASLPTLRETRAAQGAEKLSRFIDGLQTSRTEEPRNMTVIGHSYGSVTTAVAAVEHGLDADDIVLIGSPGVGNEAQHADDLGADQVWAGKASQDSVAKLANNGSFNVGSLGQGRDPAEDIFGATRFQAEDATRGEAEAGSDHSKYFNRGTESWSNLGTIVAADDSNVTRAEHVTDPTFGDGQEWSWESVLGTPDDPERNRTPSPTLSDEQIEAAREAVEGTDR